MLIYNTTFQVDDDVHDNFMIWIKESYIPEVQKHGALKAPRICRILSHREEGSAYSLQWEVESSGLLHRWHLEQGVRLNDELVKIFKDKSDRNTADQIREKHQSLKEIASPCLKAQNRCKEQRKRKLYHRTYHVVEA